jgi:hypothetical protein
MPSKSKLRQLCSPHFQYGIFTVLSKRSKVIAPLLATILYAHISDGEKGGSTQDKTCLFLVSWLNTIII